MVQFITLVSDGGLSQVTSQWIAGAVGFLVILAVILGVFKSFRDIRKEAIELRSKSEKEASDRMKEELAKARIEITREVELQTALASMKQSIDKLTESFYDMGKGMTARIDLVEANLENACKVQVRVHEVAKAAHRRMDEHRRLDHGLSNHQYHEVEEINERTDT